MSMQCARHSRSGHCGHLARSARGVKRLLGPLMMVEPLILMHRCYHLPQTRVAKVCCLALNPKQRWDSGSGNIKEIKIRGTWVIVNTSNTHSHYRQRWVTVKASNKIDDLGSLYCVGELGLRDEQSSSDAALTWQSTRTLRKHLLIRRGECWSEYSSIVNTDDEGVHDPTNHRCKWSDSPKL